MDKLTFFCRFVPINVSRYLCKHICNSTQVHEPWHEGKSSTVKDFSHAHNFNKINFQKTYIVICPLFLYGIVHLRIMLLLLLMISKEQGSLLIHQAQQSRTRPLSYQGQHQGASLKCKTTHSHWVTILQNGADFEVYGENRKCETEELPLSRPVSNQDEGNTSGNWCDIATTASALSWQ